MTEKDIYFVQNTETGGIINSGPEEKMIAARKDLNTTLQTNAYTVLSPADMAALRSSQKSRTS